MNSGGYARTTECASRVRLVLGGTPRAYREHCRCIFPSLKRQTERRCPIRREGRTTSLPGSATTRRTSRQPRPTAAGQFGGSPVPSNLCSPSRMTAPHRIGVRRWRHARSNVSLLRASMRRTALRGSRRRVQPRRTASHARAYSHASCAEVSTCIHLVQRPSCQVGRRDKCGRKHVHR